MANPDTIAHDVLAAVAGGGAMPALVLGTSRSDGRLASLGSSMAEVERMDPKQLRELCGRYFPEGRLTMGGRGERGEMASRCRRNSFGF